MKPLLTTYMAVAALLALGWPPTLQALQVTQLQTAFYQDEYRLTMTATLAAPIAQVRAVLHDYAQYPALDERIVESQVLSRSAPGELRLRTRIKVCFAFFCRTLRRVEQVTERGNTLLAEVLPQHSDALLGSTITELHAVQSAASTLTQVIYETRIVPKFWVPRVGRASLLRNMQEATVSLFTRIEQRASQLSSAPLRDPATPAVTP